VSDAMRRAEEQTKDYGTARLNVCLCYNSKNEILHAVESTAELAAQEKLPSQIKNSQASTSNNDIKVTLSDFES